MRTLILTLATAAAGLAIAAPASAQYYPQPQPYGGQYGAPYGNAYGYNNNYGQFRALDARIDNLQREIRRMDARNIISEREANRLKEQSRNLERQLAFMARDGLNPYEANQAERGIARLEQRIWREARDRDGRYGNRGYGTNYGYNQGNWSDRDRDGREDRYEDDRGTRHD